MSAFTYYAGAADEFHWSQIRDGCTHWPPTKSVSHVV